MTQKSPHRLIQLIVSENFGSKVRKPTIASHWVHKWMTGSRAVLEKYSLIAFNPSSSKKETTPGSKSKENSNLSYLFHFQEIYFRLKSNFRFRKLLFLISHEFILLRLIALLCFINLIQQIIHRVLLYFIFHIVMSTMAGHAEQTRPGQFKVVL